MGMQPFLSFDEGPVTIVCDSSNLLRIFYGDLFYITLTDLRSAIRDELSAAFRRVARP